MDEAYIHLRMPAATKARWVRESRAVGMRLTDWIVQKVDGGDMMSYEQWAANIGPRQKSFSEAAISQAAYTAERAFNLDANSAAWLAGVVSNLPMNGINPTRNGPLFLTAWARSAPVKYDRKDSEIAHINRLRFERWLEDVTDRNRAEQWYEHTIEAVKAIRAADETFAPESLLTIATERTAALRDQSDDTITTTRRRLAEAFYPNRPGLKS